MDDDDDATNLATSRAGVKSDKWPVCGAHARRTGKPCRALGAGIGRRCRFHGGAALRGNWGDDVTFSVWLGAGSKSPHIEPSRQPRGWRKKSWPQAVSFDIARRLIINGQVTEGVFWRRGQRLLEAVESRGVVVTTLQDGWGIKRVAFQAPPKRPRTPWPPQSTPDAE